MATQIAKTGERTAEVAYAEHMGNLKSNLLKLLNNIKTFDKENKEKMNWAVVGSIEYVSNEVALLNEFFGE